MTYRLRPHWQPPRKGRCKLIAVTVVITDLSRVESIAGKLKLVGVWVLRLPESQEAAQFHYCVVGGWLVGVFVDLSHMRREGQIRRSFQVNPAIAFRPTSQAPPAPPGAPPVRAPTPLKVKLLISRRPFRRLSGLCSSLNASHRAGSPA